VKGKNNHMKYGIALATIIGIVAFALSPIIPIGAVAIAILIGMLIANTIKLDSKYSSGITYAEKSILAFAIATLGINLDFSVLAELGFSTIIIIVLGMIVTIYSTLFIAQFFGIDKKFALLLGIGNGVCGASAVGATKGIIKAKDDEVGISVAVVNFLGTVGIFLVPFIALMIGFDEREAGILVGNTLQAVGQAVAGGFAISDIAGESATVVKMGRVLMLTPLIIILLWIYKKNATQNNSDAKSIVKNIPMFIVWFIGFSIIATLQILPQIVVDIIAMISKYALIIAMAGIGLKISFSSIKENGKNALVVGSLVFFVQIIFTALLLIVI
jgi:uncharacterized integral membrane protein (TIGR00698 family)